MRSEMVGISVGLAVNKYIEKKKSIRNEIKKYQNTKNQANTYAYHWQIKGNLKTL